VANNLLTKITVSYVLGVVVTTVVVVASSVVVGCIVVVAYVVVVCSVVVSLSLVVVCGSVVVTTVITKQYLELYDKLSFISYVVNRSLKTEFYNSLIDYHLR